MYKKICFLAVITAILLISVRVVEAKPFYSDNVCHIYIKKRFARWDVDIVKDCENFIKEFKIVIYAREKLNAIVILSVKNKTILTDKFIVDFAAERIYKINASYGTYIHVNITLYAQKYKKTITLKLRYSKEKGALGKLQEIIEMTLKELQEYINRLKEKFYAYALTFMLCGMIHAYSIKKKFLLESVKNPLNVIGFLFALLLYSAVAQMKEEHPLLLMIYLIANIVTYNLIPLETVIIEKFDVGSQIKHREVFVIYSHDGELCVAPQDVQSAIERAFFNKHIKLKMLKEGRFWTEIEDDEESDLIIAESYQIRERAIVESLEVEEESMSEKLLQKLKPKIRRIKELVIDPASAHEFNIIRFITDYWKSFKELSRKYEKVVSENVKLKTQLSALSIERGRQLTVELLDLLDKTIFKGGEDEQAV